MPNAEHGGVLSERDGQDAVWRFVERFALDLVAAGVPRMPARVFAGLLVADDMRRTATGIAELLRISPAAVSGAVRYLTQVGLIAKERAPGQRRDHYRVRDDLWYETVVQREEMLADWQRSLEAGVEAVGRDSAAGRRLEESRRFFGFLREEMPALMAKWRSQRASE